MFTPLPSPSARIDPMPKPRRIPAVLQSQILPRPDQTPHKREYSQHGPYQDPASPEPPVDVLAIAAAAPWANSEGREGICGLIAPYSRKARNLLIDLVSGSTLTTARARQVLPQASFDYWRDNWPEYRAAVDACYELGTLRFEDELRRRALAGIDDKASMRALELIAKSRNADYRDRAQQDMAIVAALGTVLQSARGWRALPAPSIEPDGSATP